jgi:uncharacterized protein (TIGR03067 family)
MKTLFAMVMLIGGVLFYRMKFTAPGDDLQGRWTIVSAPEGWKVAPGMDVMVTSDEIQMRIGTVVTSKLHYTADFETGTIDTTAAGGKLRQGIYRLDGDTLTLCVGEEGGSRPDTPDATGGGTMRWVLRRGAHL